MTRKRYTKLLMAQGYSRNEVNEFARRVVERGGSYHDDYYGPTPETSAALEALARLTAPVSRIDLSGINAALAEMAESAEKTCKKMQALFADFGERLQGDRRT